MARYMFVFLLISLACSRDENADREWISLFNGRDLSGWDIKITGHELNENYNNTFRVEDGLLKVSYDEYASFDGEFGHLFYEETFSRYILRVEYRFVGQQAPGGPEWALRNSGVMLHSQSAESMAIDQEFPVSIEAQFLGGDGAGERPTGNVCTPGTHIVMDGELVTEHCVDSRSKTYRGDQWVTIDIEVRGDRLIRHVIDGKTVVEYSEPRIGGERMSEDFVVPDDTPLTEGYIALQAESHPVEFRKVEILDLSAGGREGRR